MNKSVNPQEGNRGNTPSFSEQFTLRGMVIGILGSIVLTCSSMYVALKLGALPFPIIFVAIVSMFFLKLFGNTNINEINVTHTAMSAGAMTAGGLAFTIPGIYILNPNADVSFLELLLVVLAGVLLGLIFTALVRKYFIETKELPYPMGQAAAETLLIGDKGGKKAGLLFGTLGLAAIWTALRDYFLIIPAILPKMATTSSLSSKFGIVTGIWASPMLISVGYIVGPVFIGVWFLGALLGNFGILVGGTHFDFFDFDTANAVKQSLGIGLMVGTGIGILIKGIIPKAKEIFGPMFKKSERGKESTVINLRWAPFVCGIIIVVLNVFCNIPLVVGFILIIGSWFCTTMSSQTVGQSGINPMEIFGIIILLLAITVSSIGNTEAFFVAAVIAIASGLTGDVMNDFKAGYILKTNTKAQWLGEAIGGIVGAFVSVLVFYLIITAYGPESLGNPEGFIAPQAGMVAAMVGGIPNITAFVIGLVVAVILYVLNFPVMTLGLGVYLPFYLSATAFVGGVIRFIVNRFFPNFEKKGTGTIIASGLLGGEAVAGVVIALIQAIPALVSI